MTTIRKITAGPSRWDLMQSLFTGSNVIFTLDKKQVLEGEVLTLHKHNSEVPLSSNPNDYPVNVARLDWLIYVEFSYDDQPNLCCAYIEYDVTTRSGLCVLYSDAEFQDSDFPFLADEWARMMGL